MYYYPIIGWIALFFVIFEVAQPVVAQRYIGIDQIRSGLHPVEVDQTGPRILPVVWVTLLIYDYVFQFVLLFWSRATVLPGLMLIVVSLIGFGLRRAWGMRWALVVLTFEGAMRAGFLGFVFIFNVIQPHWRGWNGYYVH